MDIMQQCAHTVEYPISIGVRPLYYLWLPLLQGRYDLQYWEVGGPQPEQARK